MGCAMHYDSICTVQADSSQVQALCSARLDCGCITGDQFISASVAQQLALAITADSILMCYSFLQQLVDASTACVVA